MQFVEANSFQNASRTKADIDRIVVHTAEIELSAGAAEAIAGFFSNPTTEVSAHKCSDSDSVVRCVRDEDIAFHAAGDNPNTLGIEICTRASTSKEKWARPEHQAALHVAARTCAEWAVLYDIPARWLTADQERNHERGFVTHKIVSDVFGEGIRSDPGAEFPYIKFMALVKQAMTEVRWELWAKKSKAANAPVARVAASTWVNGANSDAKFNDFYPQMKTRVRELTEAGRRPQFRRQVRRAT